MDIIIQKMTFVDQLQKEAELFLAGTALQLGGITILPKEIEAYYYQTDAFEDNSVHRNELQQNNKNHFYIHRWGKTRSDAYKGGNYAGIDFVVSDSDNVYHTYLIRSALVNNEMVVGPHKVLEAIGKQSCLVYPKIEESDVEVVSCSVAGDIMFSSRINLGKTVLEEYRAYKLRAVLCDENFRESLYPAKEKMVTDYLIKKVQAKSMTKEQASQYAKNCLGYIPSSIKAL